MKNLVPSPKGQKSTLSEFSGEKLAWELLRLKNLFIPEFRVPSVFICVGKKASTKAAETHYTHNKIVMFKEYHETFPEDYKVTLLHELGHIIADYAHGENFKKYYNLLRERQCSIEEAVIPDSYCEFLYCKISEHYTKQYFCPICRAHKIYTEEMSVECEECKIPMLENMFFEGIEAIVPSEFKATIDRSVMGVPPLRHEDRIC